MKGPFDSPKGVVTQRLRTTVLEPELQVAVSCMIWALGAESGSSAGAANALDPLSLLLLIVAAGGLWVRAEAENLHLPLTRPQAGTSFLIREQETYRLGASSGNSEVRA